ncbi:glycerate kinase II [uncultured delta proteobacterium]|uniref:Glycerate kinase II n=1 Tax=uncultured delta proteobacterium TaxID=34034 RepID=A0A212JGQ1_9DELT|nr:glycerate kinase II [uncultured delta proteobacterium]
MHILIAPDSYKGSLSALDVAEAMETGAKRVFPGAAFDLVPIADGGEGTVDALVAATNGTFRETRVKGPKGDPVNAKWGLFGDGKTAVIEMASASGLPLLAPDDRDALNACTYGTGELVRAALDEGVTAIILGIGGSATNDGGTGFARALGAKFLDGSGNALPPGGAALANLASIDLSGLDPRLAKTDIRVACDVDNPLCGPRGASAVFGPQKGATPAQVKQLDAALGVFAAVAAKTTGKTQVAETAGAGAAGGLGAALLYFTGAALMPGVTLVLDAVNFDARVKKADLVFTGEGRTDFQTAYGKAPAGVAQAAKKYGIPVVCLSGGMGKGADDVLAQGIDAIFSIAPGPISLQECLENGKELLQNAAERICRLLKAGAGLKI